MKKSSSFSVLTILLGLSFALWWFHTTEEQITARRYRVPLAGHDTVQKGTRYQPVKVAEVLTPQEQKRLTDLQSILDLKNDNDPRLDSQFRNLSEREKREIEKKYLAYAPEKLNERGTLLFLLGRNLKSSQDVEFLAQALAEPACHSLTNCREVAPQPFGEGAHEESANAITLAYPQIVSIKSLEKALADETFEVKALHLTLIETLKVGLHSENRVVAQLAKKALNKFEP